MPTASYQQPNDYSLVKDIRPFDLPYSAVMQEIATKTQYWKAGADRVKSIYDQAAGLNPQFTVGKDYIKGFMTEAQKNLEKVSKSDLGIMDNAQQAALVFKPLFDTKNPFNAALLKDDYINKHYTKQDALSTQYKNKDGGKEWNINNDIYYKDGEAKYLNDAKNGDYSSIDAHYNNMKSFIPFYDGKKEITDIQEACKGASSDVQRPISGTLYTQNVKNSGCTPMQLAMAYKTGLSDRFKQQARIDGYVTFRGNEDSLLKRFKDIKLDRVENEIKELNSEKIALELGGITEKEKNRVANLTELIKIKGDILTEAKSEYVTITKGNPEEYIKNNYEKVSGDVYWSELTDQLGISFRTDDHTDIIKPDVAAMQVNKINNERAENVLDRNHDFLLQAQKASDARKLEELKQEGDLTKAKLDAILKGDVLGGPPGIIENVTHETPGIRKITPEIFQTEEIDANKALTEEAKTTLIHYVWNKTGQKLSYDAVMKFVKDNKSKDKAVQDEDLNKFYNNFNAANLKYTDALDLREASEKELKASRKDLFDDSKFSDKKVLITNFKTESKSSPWVNTENSKISLSEKDMFAIVNGANIGGFAIKPSVFDNGQKKYELYFNGKKVLPDAFTGGKYLNELFYKIRDKNIDLINERNTLLTDKYTDLIYNDGRYTKPPVIKKDGTIENQIISMFTGADKGLKGRGEPGGYQIIAGDGTGEGLYIVTLNSEGQPETPSTDVGLKLRTEGTDGGIRLTPYGGKAYFIPHIAKRVEGLSGDYELADNMKREKSILTKQKLIVPQLVGNYASSKSLGAAGIKQEVTGKGESANIYYVKEGGHGQVSYKIELMIKGQLVTIPADSPSEVIQILKQN